MSFHGSLPDPGDARCDETVNPLRSIAAGCFEAIIHDPGVLSRWGEGRADHTMAIILDGRTVRKLPETRRGFVLLRGRLVERSFAWVARNYERMPKNLRRVACRRLRVLDVASIAQVRGAGSVSGFGEETDGRCVREPACIAIRA